MGNNSKESRQKQKEERLGEERLNNQGCLMEIIEYNDCMDILIMFNDEYHATVRTTYNCFKNGSIRNPFFRIGDTSFNKQNCKMKIIEYNNSHDIIIEFQDDYKAKVHTSYQAFVNGEVKNPYYPSVCGVGITGNRYQTNNKEYETWSGILERSFDKKSKNKNPTYKDVTCCDEWLLYDNFYEWLHKQKNFDKWIDGYRWAIDKDILVKGNKIYSPETCCLVPMNVNELFVKNDAVRGDLPVGVTKYFNKFKVQCVNPFTNKIEYFGLHNTIKSAFFAYKNAKENFIKQVAKTEYSKGNITEKCCDAMMNYEVEITD